MKAAESLKARWIPSAEKGPQDLFPGADLRARLWFYSIAPPTLVWSERELPATLLKAAESLKARWIPSAENCPQDLFPGADLRARLWFLFYVSQKNNEQHKLLAISFGSPNWARTSDIMINSHALSLLSHSAPDCVTQVIVGQVFEQTGHSLSENDIFFSLALADSIISNAYPLSMV